MNNWRNWPSFSRAHKSLNFNILTKNVSLNFIDQHLKIERNSKLIVFLVKYTKTYVLKDFWQPTVQRNIFEKTLTELKLVAHIFMLNLVPFASKLTNYLRRSAVSIWTFVRIRNRQFVDVQAFFKCDLTNGLVWQYFKRSFVPQANSSGGSSLIASQDEDRMTLFPYEAHEASLASLGAVGGTSSHLGLDPPDGTAVVLVNGLKKVNEESKQQNVAVPKNIQRNIISR